MTQKEIDQASKQWVDERNLIDDYNEAFKEGVKYAQSKMYSEEEVLELIKKGYYNHYNSLTIEQWFEINKKK